MYPAFKVSKKSKEYVQMNVRTMFFDKLDAGKQEVPIDHIVHTISRNADTFNYDCRAALFDLFNLFADVTLE